MEERKITLFPDEQPNLAKKNSRDLAIGIILFIGVIILMAKTGESLIIAMLLGFICIGIPGKATAV